jgi:hypothetical protein
MALNNLVKMLNKQMDAGFTEEISGEKLNEEMNVFIDELIKNDFQKLIQILYKVDINEAKLKQLLQQNSGKDPSKIISNLIIERLHQKIESRKNFASPNDIKEDEKW